MNPWLWRSYRDFYKEIYGSFEGEPHAHRFAAGSVAAIVVTVFLGFAMGTLFIWKRYVDRHLLKYGFTTRAVVVKFIPNRSRKHPRRAKADIRFVINKDDTVTYRVKPLKEYRPGDSVTVNYSSEDPSFCEIEEGQWRQY